MDGDEVQAPLSMDARADPRLVFDMTGRPFPPVDWPDEIANSIETFELHENGCIRRIKFTSKAAAQRTILEMSGKLKSQTAARRQSCRRERLAIPRIASWQQRPANTVIA